MIKVIFTNGTNSVDLQYVRSVEWQSQIDPNNIVSTSSRVGKKTRTVTINGFINNSMFADNIKAQQNLEANLIAVGVGTIAITGANDITDARFISLEIDEFRGNPVCPFTINFTTEEINYGAHTPIRIGGVTLDTANGYETVTVAEKITTQGPDERLSSVARKTITIEGTIIGSDLNSVNQRQQAILNEIQNVDAVTLVFSANTGTYIAAISARVGSVDFTAPRIRGDSTARQFKVEFNTHDDYSKEPYTLGEQPLTIGSPGTITLDIVSTFDHDKEFDKNSYTNQAQYVILGETLNISGKKYFNSYNAYQNFRSLFTPIPAATYLYTSSTQNILELNDISVGTFERDGNYPTTNEKRYSATISLTFTWKKSIAETNFSVFTTYFGITFYKVPNITFGASVDSYGNITSRSISLNGEVIGAALAFELRNLIGQPVEYDNVYNNLIISSVNIGGVDTIMIGGVKQQVYSVSISASQLSTASQANKFIEGIFEMSKAGGSGTSYDTEVIAFNNVTSMSKSISNIYNNFERRFVVSSITISISGEIFDNDNGSSNGQPTNPYKIVNLFNKIDSLLAGTLSEPRGTHTVTGSYVLPSEGSVRYILNNINVGQWQADVAPANIQILNGGSLITKGQRYWKQSVSVSATAVFDLGGGGGGGEPDYVDSDSWEIEEQTDRYTQLQVVGFGTVFKKVGINPSRFSRNVERQYSSPGARARDNGWPITTTPAPFGFWGASSSGDHVLVRENRSATGTSKRWSAEYEATKDLRN